MPRALVLNGPNLNLLGQRETHIYGVASYAELIAAIEGWASELGISAQCLQSNHEGALIDAIHAAHGQADFIVFNPGGYTHTSVALRDAVAAVGIPTIEVHLSNVAAREEFRQRSMIAAVCRGTVAGFGIFGYRMALDAGLHLIR